MGAYAGPEIVNDGLVFYYDMENIDKSFKGKPTTNLFTNPVFSTGTQSPWSYQTIENGTREIDTTFLREGYNTAKITRTSLGGEANFWVNGETVNAAILPNTEYTFSADVWSNKANQAAIFSFFSTTSTGFNYHSGSGQWERISHTFTTRTTSPVTQLRMWSNTTTLNNPVWFTKLQLEEGLFSTPFVNGTRSDTEAILDLTNNNTITANSLTYNDVNTFNFNGTTDFISIPRTVLSSTGSSVSAWIYIDDFSTGKSSTGRTFIRGNSFFSMIAFYNGGYSFETDTNSNPHEISGRTSGNVLSSAITAGSWFHFTLVFNSGTFTGYVNGIQTGSAAISNNLTVDRIGDATGFVDVYPAFFKGNIAALSIYNTALTATEVGQNYNAHKGRFGI